DGDLTEAAEWPGAAAHREKKRIAKQERRIVSAEVVRVWRGEARLSHGLGLERKVDEGLVFLRAGDRTDTERVGGAAGEHHPLAPASRDQGAWTECRVGHACLPSTAARRSKVEFHVERSPKRMTSKPRSSS